ncbi:thymidine phosphorylase [Collinsella vaginalis]|uniref:thymidine phosphorylase n=1 Tax=Collinsella vaginalis TaxID=1870987 RepID=UPI000BEA9A49|nr:thymidine phosphorylase [Collinsella vaginalis]
MRMYDVIERKREGAELTDEEIGFVVDGYVSGEIPDYQMSAWLMAVFLRGMTDAETRSLTLHMMASGDVVDLSNLPGVTLDKHSTGGVGDKTSLAVMPMLAAMAPGRAFVAKMSGRGLRHTGGTLDKLESIPGFTISLDEEDFLAAVRAHGGAIIGQTGNLVPADKLIYALRDVTATVDSIPLIASSIMSKKLAAGAQCILLDVKVGSGAFMKTVDEAVQLASAMVAIGEGAGRRVEAMVTNMDRPLGHAVGNALEVAEVVDTLRGRGPADLTHEVVMLTAELFHLGGLGTVAEGRALAEHVIADGSAFEKLCEITTAQGGDARTLRDPALLGSARIRHELLAPADGFLTAIDTERVGVASAELGAGRLTLDDAIDHTAGIVLLKNQGDAVRAGETVAVLHTATEDRLAAGLATLRAALTFGTDAHASEPLLFATVTRDGVAYANEAAGARDPSASIKSKGRI